MNTNTRLCTTHGVVQTILELAEILPTAKPTNFSEFAFYLLPTIPFNRKQLILNRSIIYYVVGTSQIATHTPIAETIQIYCLASQ